MNDSTGLLTPRRYRSGVTVIDPSQRQVTIDGELARFGARAFDLLLVLLERRDRVVSKRELLDLVWPKLVVEENNLQVHVAALRKALGPQAIATIPGRGYQFALPIDALEPVTPRPAAALMDALESAAAPGNLPPSTSPLIGRMFDIATVEGMLRDNAVVSIVGAGGIGKTRLALAAASSAPGHFSDGRWWVELAPLTDGALLGQAIANTLSVPCRAGTSAVDSLATALGAMRGLIVLDNCEHLIDDVSELLERLMPQAKQVRWLVTSQESLKCSTEQVYRLGGLTVPRVAEFDTATQYGAVALFVERAHALDPRFRLAPDNLETIIEICRQLDGIPLAIELAAARVPLLGVQGLAERLDQRFNVLSGGARMKLRRHQTLRAALDWSYGLLSDEEQRVFRRLGVFAGGFTLELAQQLARDATIDEWQVLDVLARLIDRSLVIADGDARPRYSLLETARAFALEMLAENDESAPILRRHAEVMRDLLARLALDGNLSDAFWATGLRELGNVRVAMDWSRGVPGERHLACALHAFAWPVFQRAGFAHEFTQRMLTLWPFPADLPVELEAECMYALGRLGCSSGSEHCRAGALRAVELFEQLGERARLADALIQLAFVERNWSTTDIADAALARAEVLVDESTPPLVQARLACGQTFRAIDHGDLEAQIAASRRHADLARMADDNFGELIGLHNVGCGELSAGRFDEAIAVLTEVVARYRAQHSPNTMGLTLVNLAVALALRGDDIDLLPLAREGHVKSRLIGSANCALVAAALQHVRQGDPERAVVLAGFATADMRRWKSKPEPSELALPGRVLERCADKLEGKVVERLCALGAELDILRAEGVAFDGMDWNGTTAEALQGMLERRD